MSNRITDLGIDWEGYCKATKPSTVEKVYKELKKQVDATKNYEVLGDNIELRNDDWYITATEEEPEQLIGHSNCLEHVGKVLKVPVPYMERLGVDMRAMNINYELNRNKDKAFCLSARHNKADNTPYVFDFFEKGAERIELIDCLHILYEKAGGKAVVYKTSSSLGPTLIDVIITEKEYKTKKTKYYGGVRFIYKKVYQAPEVSPIFINLENCGIIECSHYLEPISIRNLVYDDVLRVIENKVDNVVDSLDGLFYTIKDVEENEVKDIRKRLQHLCREHGVAGQVAATVVTYLDDYKQGEKTGIFGEMIDLLSSVGFVDTIKESSERGLQQLAGFLVLKSHREHRCGKCDALLIEE